MIRTLMSGASTGVDTIKGRALTMLWGMLNGYTQTARPDLPTDEVDGTATIRIGETMTFGLFVPEGQCRRRVLEVVARRLDITRIAGVDDVDLANEIDKALVRRFHELEAFEQSRLTLVIRVRTEILGLHALQF